MSVYVEDVSSGLRFLKFNPFQMLFAGPRKELGDYPLVKVRFNSEQMEATWRLLMVKKGWVCLVKEDGNGQLTPGIMSVETFANLNRGFAIPYDLIEVPRRFKLAEG